MNERPISVHLTRDLDPNAIREVWDRIEAKRGPRRRSVRIWSLLGAIVALAVLLFVMRRPASIFDEPEGIRLESGTSLPSSLSGDVALDDGSKLEIAPGTSLVPVVNAGRALAFTQAAGTVTFDVRPHGPRSWTIDAGLARVFVIGTRFRVSRAAHRVRVDVERGTVLVASEHLEGGQRYLTAGQSVEVIDEVEPTPSPPVVPSTLVKESGASSSENAPPARSAKVSAQPTPRSSWRPLVEKGDYRAAYEALGQGNVAAETGRASTVEDLLRIADVARLSGHPQDAVAPLERLVTLHGADPRAATAAFTLGKVHLDALGAPAPAAVAFEKAIALGLPGALRDDAFARRVEAYARTGDQARAKAARAAYEEAFLEGRHREAVARWAP
jgi:transmembrane sensor